MLFNRFVRHNPRRAKRGVDYHEPIEQHELTDLNDGHFLLFLGTKPTYGQLT